jgi:hypothetical protein
MAEPLSLLELVCVLDVRRPVGVEPDVERVVSRVELQFANRKRPP